MTRTAEETDFRKKMDVLRSRHEIVRPPQIAAAAIESGLSPIEALQHAQRASHFGRPQNAEVYDATTAFVATICEPVSRTSVLEYTALLSLLTERLIDNVALPVTVVSQDAAVTEVADLVFGQGHTFSSIDALDPSQRYDRVICQPPFGHRSKEPNSDSFGGEIVTALAPLVSDNGRLLWLSSRGVLFAHLAKATLNRLEDAGLNVTATVDIPAGGFPSTAIEGVLIVLERRVPSKKLVGALRDKEVAAPMADALLKGATTKGGSSWAWIDKDDTRSYADLENAALLMKLIPRGRYEQALLGDIIGDGKIAKADKPIADDSKATGFLYVPEYAGSRVTADLDSQTVKPQAVYRVPLDTRRVNPRFLATLLNGPYGRKVRAASSQGATIQRVSVASLKSLALPLPDLETQERVTRIESDLSLMVSTFGDLQETVMGDWTGLADAERTIDRLKSVLDVERQIENWWRELPYPLATIYRRYQIARDPKERLDRLLHFFEMAAVYLAAIGTSHVKALKSDWQNSFAKWFHPAGAAGIERADFGFWIALAGASLKDLSRIASDPKLRAAASDHAGPELVEVASKLGPLGKTTDILDVVRRYRNSWKGHGGHLKTADAKRLDHELQQSIRDFYEATSRIFRRLLFVRPGLAEITDSGLVMQVQLLTGSDPAFETETVELSRPSRTGAMAFWMTDARAMCRALPFFRLGAPQEPQETSFYVFNRVENGGFRWISYQEAREQEFVAPDDELLSLIALPKGGNT